MTKLDIVGMLVCMAAVMGCTLAGSCGFVLVAQTLWERCRLKEATLHTWKLIVNWTTWAFRVPTSLVSEYRSMGIFFGTGIMAASAGMFWFWINLLKGLAGGAE